MANFGDFRLVWSIVVNSQGSIDYFGQYSEDFRHFWVILGWFWTIFGHSQGYFGHFFAVHRGILVIFAYLRAILAVLAVFRLFPAVLL